MSFIWFAWATNIFYASGTIVGKISTKYQLKNPWLFNFVWMFLTFIFIIPLCVVSGFGWPSDWISILILSLVNAVASSLYILCLNRIEVSILSPLFSLKIPIAVLLGVILFKEILTSVQIFLIGLIFFASIFVGLDEKMNLKSFLSEDKALAFLAMLTSTIFNISIKYASIHNGFWEVTFWSNFLGFVFILPTIPLFLSDLKSTKPVQYKGVAWSAVFATLGMLSSLKALGSNVGIASAIMSLPLSMLMAIALSFISPKLLEKHSPKVYAIRLIAATVMITAALGLSR